GLVAAHQHDRRCFPPERHRGGSTDPARGASHNDCLVTKQHAGESYTPCLAEGTLSWPEHSPARPKRVRIQKFPAETTETCRQAFCLAEAWTQRMPPFLSSEDVYSAREIALAAGVSEAQVAALMG